FVLLLGFYIFGQSIYVTSQITLNQMDEPTVSSPKMTSDVKVAHITETPTLPIVHEHKTDVSFISKKVIIYHPESIANAFRFPPPNVAELLGFLDVRKYHSNYLS